MKRTINCFVILSAREGSVISLKSYNAVAIAVRNHLFPFRTEKLSSPAQMVLTYQLGEYVAAVLRDP